MKRWLWPIVLAFCSFLAGATFERVAWVGHADSVDAAVLVCSFILCCIAHDRMVRQ